MWCSLGFRMVWQVHVNQCITSLFKWRHNAAASVASAVPAAGRRSWRVSSEWRRDIAVGPCNPSLMEHFPLLRRVDPCGLGRLIRLPLEPSFVLLLLLLHHFVSCWRWRIHYFIAYVRFQTAHLAPLTRWFQSIEFRVNSDQFKSDDYLQVSGWKLSPVAFYR